MAGSTGLVGAAVGAAGAAPKVDATLRFYEEVLGLSYLHYGLWDGEPLTLDGLASAQQRYAERLLATVPAGVRSVLDVGCGTGGNARLFASKGYEVEGLSPDPFQERRFAEKTGGLPFHLSRFEHFVASRRYDLVLMSESSQYIRISRLFDAVREASPDGWLLVADYFVHTRTDTPLGRSGHNLALFRKYATADGFSILEDVDITEAVLPTLALANDWLEQRARPALRILEDRLAQRHPWLWRLGRWLAGSVFRRKLTSITEQAELVDVDAFRKAKSYRIFLIKVPPAKGSSA